MQYCIRTPDQLGLALRVRRKGLQLTQAEAAESIGMLQKTVSRLELDPKTAMVDSLFDLLSALDLEIVLQEKQRTVSNEQLPW
ncbi:MAG: transcriptional regulator [Ignavibacteria bacterium]|nr:MAG: transcriptional regulator [Ignavibacteria bacterium]